MVVYVKSDTALTFQSAIAASAATATAATATTSAATAAAATSTTTTPTTTTTTTTTTAAAAAAPTPTTVPSTPAIVSAATGAINAEIGSSSQITATRSAASIKCTVVVEHYDSMSGYDPDIYEQLRGFLVQLYPGIEKLTWSYEVNKKCPQQSNGYECGVHCLLNCLAVLRRQEFASESLTAAARSWLLQLLLTATIK